MIIQDSSIFYCKNRNEIEIHWCWTNGRIFLKKLNRCTRQVYENVPFYQGTALFMSKL